MSKAVVGALLGAVAISALATHDAVYMAQAKRPIVQEVTAIVTVTERIPGPVRYLTEYETEYEVETETEYITEARTPDWRQRFDHEQEHRRLVTPGLMDEVCTEDFPGNWDCE